MTEQLVSTFNELFEASMTEERRKKLLEAYRKPKDNSVASSRGNLLVWKAVNADTRTSNLKLQKLGSRTARAAYAHVYLVDLLFKSKSDGEAPDF